MRKAPIPALTPEGAGFQFAFYGDSCSGVAGGIHEESHARVNRVVARLKPAPEFIIYPGDEIIGLMRDEAALRQQWRYWLEHEMAWLDRNRIPIFHSTGNHTTFDAMSERIFAEVMAHLPRNGAPGQEGLSYFIRQGELLLVFIHTLCTSLGGEGQIETEWLEQTLLANRDAKWKFVIGHHPAYTVNGYAGCYQRNIGDEYVGDFWRILVENRVVAYLCSHILAFDAQCHRGVLQITSAGAGTAHRMPEGVEYMHAVQMAIDEDGLRYQVLDDEGVVRERLSWPPRLKSVEKRLQQGDQAMPAIDDNAAVAFRFSGRAANAESGARQTFLAAYEAEVGDAKAGARTLWIGLVGVKQQLTIAIQVTAGRSPHHWYGPGLVRGAAFDLQVMLH